MDIDQTPTTPKTSGLGDKMDTDESAVKTEEEKEDGAEKKDGDEAKDGGLKKRMEKEKVGYHLENMSRVVPGQRKFITFPEGRYEPVKKPTGGVILLIDTTPSEPKSLMELKAKKTVKPAVAPETLQDRVTAAFNQQEAAGANRPVTGGAAEAAGVLTAVDEDAEGAEEAEVPREFEFYEDEQQEEEQ